MKQLLLENPRRSKRRVRRNSKRTPLSSLYRNKPITTGMVDEEYKSNFDSIFRKKKTTKRKKTMAKRKRKGKRKGKLNAGLRRYLAMKRKSKRKSSGSKPKRRRKRRSTRTKTFKRRKARASRGMRRRRKRNRRRSSVRTITIPRSKSKRRTYTMKIRVNRRGGANLRGFVSQFTSRENLSLAGGVLLAPIVTDFVVKMLPASIKDIGGAGSNVNRALISAGVAGLGAMLTNRFSPAIAKGMVISGLASAITAFIPRTAGTTPSTAGRYLGEYLDPTRSTGAYIAPRGMGRMGNYAGGAMASQGIPSAFNAWAK